VIKNHQLPRTSFLFPWFVSSQTTRINLFAAHTLVGENTKKDFTREFVLYTRLFLVITPTRAVLFYICCILKLRHFDCGRLQNAPTKPLRSSLLTHDNTLVGENTNQGGAEGIYS
jgi:hypothetical protein